MTLTWVRRLTNNWGSPSCPSSCSSPPSGTLSSSRRSAPVWPPPGQGLLNVWKIKSNLLIFQTKYSLPQPGPGRRHLYNILHRRCDLPEDSRSDWINSLFSGQLMWTIVDSEWEFGDAACKLFKFFQTFGLTSSTYLVVAIALDRWGRDLLVNTIDGLRAARQRTGKRVKRFYWLLFITGKWTLPPHLLKCLTRDKISSSAVQIEFFKSLKIVGIRNV